MDLQLIIQDQSTPPIFCPVITTPFLLYHHSILCCLTTPEVEIRMGGGEGQKSTGVYRDNVLGPVPSRDEVQKAMSDFQSYMEGNTSTKSSEFNQLNEIFNTDSTITQATGYRRVQEAYHLLKTEPSVQKMVISISSDKVVWDAIASNKAVKDLHESLHKVKEDRICGPQTTSVEEPDIAALVIKWILGITRSKIGDLIVKFGLLVSEMFKPAASENPSEELPELPVLLEEKLRSSLLLSVVILLIVVVTRGNWS